MCQHIRNQLVLPKIIERFRLLEGVFGDDSDFIVYSGDIKEMYTHLPQNVIIEAIKWILGILHSRSRRSEVSVNLLSSKLNRLGKSYSYDESFVNISFQQIFSIQCLCLI